MLRGLEKPLLVVYVMVFVWSFIGGVFIYIGYSLSDALLFAVYMTCVCIIFSLPGFLLSENDDMAALIYVGVGGALGAALVFFVGLFAWLLRAGSWLQGYPQYQVWSPAGVVFVIAAICVSAGLIAAALEVLLIRKPLMANTN